MRTITAALICAAVIAAAYYEVWQEKANHRKAMQEYQFSITPDSTYIYDNERLVAVIPFDSTAKLDSVMLLDNQ
jgi:hypothetical protein